MTQKGQLAPLLGFCWPYISRNWSEKQVLFRPAKRFMVKSHGAIQAKLEGGHGDFKDKDAPVSF